ncbi:MAG TPA: hypothetical protein DCX06_11525 [Opitutae bacterium]|nr:hypothetical protein [Opitutae bacterium]
MISHTQLASWYLQLSQQLEAGLTFAEALRLSSGPRKKDRFRMADSLSRGVTITEVLRSAPNWLPKADRLFICASEQSGRISQTFALLADRHESVHDTQRKAILGILYPLAVFHVAALILPLVQMIDYEVGFEWQRDTHIRHSAQLLIPCWAALCGLYIIAKMDSPILPSLLRCLPILRNYSKKQSLADFSFALGTFIETGIGIQSAWKHAACLSKDSKIQRAFTAVDNGIKAGLEPATILSKFRVFPSEFTALYQAGAQTGKLDANLLQLARRYQVSANESLHFAALVYPGGLFVCVAGYVAYTVVIIYGGYVKMLLDFAG